MTGFNLIKRYLIATYMGLRIPATALYAHRYLIFLLIKRDITTRTSGTFLGNIWLLLQPALQVVGFWFLLGIVLKVKLPGGVPFVDYFLVGMLPWLFIAEVLTRSLNVLSEFSPLYRRTRFPVVILPLIPLILSMLLYCIITVMTILLLEGIHTLPIALVTVPLLALWLFPWCYLLSVMGLFLKDIAQFFPFLITVTLYLTPILYMPNSLPESMRWILEVNPFADLIALVHAALQDLPWSAANITRPLMVWLLLLGPSIVLFLRSEPHIREML